MITITGRNLREVTDVSLNETPSAVGEARYSSSRAQFLDVPVRHPVGPTDIGSTLENGNVSLRCRLASPRACVALTCAWALATLPNRAT